MNKIISNKLNVAAGRLLEKNRSNFQRFYSKDIKRKDNNWQDDPKCNQVREPCIKIDDQMIKSVKQKQQILPGTIAKKKIGCSNVKSNCQPGENAVEKLCKNPLPKIDACPKIKLPGCRSLPASTICKRQVTPENCRSNPCPQLSFLECLKMKYTNVQLFRRGGCEVRNRSCAPYDVNYPEI